MSRARWLALTFALLVAVVPAISGEETEQRRKETPTYESPILTLLFLPINMLIKMTSVLTPDDSAKTSRENTHPTDSTK